MRNERTAKLTKTIAFITLLTTFSFGAIADDKELDPKPDTTLDVICDLLPELCPKL